MPQNATERSDSCLGLPAEARVQGDIERQLSTTVEKGGKRRQNMRPYTALTVYKQRQQPRAVRLPSAFRIARIARINGLMQKIRG